MRYLGIDYGTKRVGIALSDQEGRFAMPHKVLPNSKKFFNELETIIRDNLVETVILGESKNFKGEDNVVMEKIRKFKDELETKVGKRVIFEPEFLTSHQAARIQGQHEKLDASAAALILQSYLDRLNS